MGVRVQGLGIRLLVFFFAPNPSPILHKSLSILHQSFTNPLPTISLFLQMKNQRCVFDFHEYNINDVFLSFAIQTIKICLWFSQVKTTEMSRWFASAKENTCLHHSPNHSSPSSIIHQIIYQPTKPFTQSSNNPFNPSPNHSQIPPILHPILHQPLQSLTKPVTKRKHPSPNPSQTYTSIHPILQQTT